MYSYRYRIVRLGFMHYEAQEKFVGENHVGSWIGISPGNGQWTLLGAHWIVNWHKRFIAEKECRSENAEVVWEG